MYSDGLPNDAIYFNVLQRDGMCLFVPVFLINDHIQRSPSVKDISVITNSKSGDWLKRWTFFFAFVEFTLFTFNFLLLRLERRTCNNKKKLLIQNPSGFVDCTIIFLLLRCEGRVSNMAVRCISHYQLKN